MKLEFLVGRVIAIDVFHRMSSGEILPMLKVRSFLDGSDLDLPWLPTGPTQIMPLVGTEVLYYSIGARNFRMVCFQGSNNPWIRKGALGLNEGEFVVQADAGLGYVKGSQDGSVEMSSGDAISDLRISDEGLESNAPSFSFKNYGGCSLEILEDTTISLERRSKDGKILSKVSLDAKNSVDILADGDVRIKAQNIYLDGKVLYGPGATDPTRAALFGDVVTAGPGGTHPFDLVSGIPIIGSSSVKAAR